MLGFILSFSSFAILFAVFGQRLGISPDAFRISATIIIGLFGLIMVFPKIQESLFAKLQPVLARVTPKTDATNQGIWSGFLLGASLGLVWTPCAGPVLGSILTLVAAKQHLPQAGALLLAYAFGAGLPMLAIAYGGQSVATRVRSIAKYTHTIQRVFGLMIIFVAIGIYTGADRNIQVWLVRNAPWLFPNLDLHL
ncbi:MAG: cytochrome c biogenesis CcdA family protein [Patescibacteria group bacterium]